MMLILFLFSLVACISAQVRAPGGDCLCLTEFRPVCGSNGQTYNNICLLRCDTAKMNAAMINCKRSSRGTEYRGRETRTRDGRECKRWDNHIGVYPLDKTTQVDPIKDSNFPEGSVTAANNFCRNPDNDHRGLWCFTGNREPFNFGFCQQIPLCEPVVQFVHDGECQSINGGDCTDNQTYARQCVFWQQQGFCRSNHPFLLQHCRRSCGYCQPRRG